MCFPAVSPSSCLMFVPSLSPVCLPVCVCVLGVASLLPIILNYLVVLSCSQLLPLFDFSCNLSSCLLVSPCQFACLSVCQSAATSSYHLSVHTPVGYTPQPESDPRLLTATCPHSSPADPQLRQPTTN